MPPARVSRRRFFSLALAAGATLSSVSCGTLLFPERRGQRGGRLDPTVILLDGLLLLLFVVPGVIAFAVDIYTGAIYLPPYEYGHVTPADFDRQTWHRVDVDRRDLTPGRVEQVVFERTGHRVRVDPAVFEHHDQEPGREVRVE
ncbi:MAG TPA: hypothetical protein VML55_12160 [Planctomycetaceae bacterium]|nr:hypothetical protein [Planctomycetaceae bacterium]